ncbi:hypothetical protein, partial [Listeria monocytogenes]|uniref:hypothetical protein n=1 Tax=Listeria monocytogenes TaxID=1639 RepID=UPI001F572D9C
MKGAADGGQIDKVIDHAAGVAKEKIGSALGGNKKAPTGKNQDAGVGDMISGAIGKAASDTSDAGKKTADE